jgi:hypothetical protein
MLAETSCVADPNEPLEAVRNPNHEQAGVSGLHMRRLRGSYPDCK